MKQACMHKLHTGLWALYTSLMIVREVLQEVVLRRTWWDEVMHVIETRDLQWLHVAIHVSPLLIISELSEAYSQQLLFILHWVMLEQTTRLLIFLYRKG